MLILSVPAAPSTVIKSANSDSLPPLITAPAFVRVNTGVPEAKEFALVIAVFKSVTSMAALLTAKDVIFAKEPAVNCLGEVATAFVSKVPTAEIVEAVIEVTAEALTATDVASLTVFKAAASAPASSVLMTIVNAFVSLTPALG